MRKLIICLWAIIGISFLLVLGCNQPSESHIPKKIATVSLDTYLVSPDNIGVMPNTGYVYITGYSKDVAILKEKELVTTLPIGVEKGMPELAVDAKRDLVYILNTSEKMLTVIKETEIVAQITLPVQSASQIAVDESTGLAYIVSGGLQDNREPKGWVAWGNITIINQTEIVDIITLAPINTHTIALDSVNGYLYVVAPRGLLFVIKDKKVVAQYQFGFGITSIAANPNTGDVYVAYRTTSGDLSHFYKGEQVEEIKLENAGQIRTIKIHPHTGDLYLVPSAYSKITVVRDMAVIGQINIGWEIARMEIDPFTGNVYATDIKYGHLTTIQGTEVLSKSWANTYPYGLGINPANGWVYVADTNRGFITIFGYK